jgi:hypothetical protein
MSAAVASEPFGVAECWLEGAPRHPVFRLYVTGP